VAAVVLHQHGRDRQWRNILPCEDDLLELVLPDTATMSALPQRTDVVSAAGHVG
jgi:hypothetical protein